jgi:hypothetical protein
MDWNKNKEDELRSILDEFSGLIKFHIIKFNPQSLDSTLTISLKKSRSGSGDSSMMRKISRITRLISRRS